MNDKEAIDGLAVLVHALKLDPEKVPGYQRANWPDLKKYLYNRRSALEDMAHAKTRIRDERPGNTIRSP